MIRFFCFVYGDDFLEMFEKVAVRSLRQTKNRNAIPQNAVVSLYTDSYSLGSAAHIASRLGKVEPHLVFTDENVADVQNEAFIDEVERCYNAGATMVIVNPDCFWGDGSLGNLLAMAGQQNVCIAAPHVRVDRDRFRQVIPPGDIGNSQLVRIAMNTLHPSWADANADNPQTSSYYAGISIREISCGIYSVSHRLPTCWLAKFTKEDMDFFHANPSGRGLWDHVWPQMLVQSERQRVVGSSDAFFIAELTDPNTHSVPLTDNNIVEPDAYCRPSFHASVNRNVAAIWRAGSAV